MFPFLSSHQKDIGLTPFESAFLNGLTAVAALVAAPISGLVAHKLDKYQTLLVITLLGSGFSFTSLLFVPRVIRSPRHPHIVFDCTNSQLRMESCSNWEGNCNLKPKLPAIGNYSNFSLTKCKYVCTSGITSTGQQTQQGPMNASWYPLHVCFSSTSEGNTCMLHDPALADRGSAWTQIQSSSSSSANNALPSDPVKYDVITFDSRFDRWPVVSLTGDSQCVFQTIAPLILDHKSYDTIQCRPFVQNCQVHCKVNLLHRPKGGSSISKPPAACLDVTGDPRITFYAYLVVRSFADLFLFVAYNLLDGLSITLTNNFDSLYAGVGKLLCLTVPLIAFPILTGSLIDYYSQQAGQPDYAPAFILFDGLILITAVLVVAAPASPLSPSSPPDPSCSNHATASTTSAAFRRSSNQASANATTAASGSQSQSSLRSNASRRVLLSHRKKHKRKIPIKNWYIFALIVIPLTLWSGIQIAILQTHMSPFLMDLGVDQLWLGISFAIIFMTYLPFCLMGKKVVSGIGRLHLVLVGLMFHGLRLTSISLLSHPKWMLLPIQSMETFTLPITWIGLTAYSHHLIKTVTLRPSELMIRSGCDTTTNSNHMRMQYFLNALHFGIARVIGCGIWMVWITMWDSGAGAKYWLWGWFMIQDPPDFPENDENGFRILLRVMALISMGCIALPILFFVHVFGHIIDCFAGIGIEIKKSLICIQNACFKCFAMLCCCSCSCKMGKCRLCKRRRRGLHQVTIVEGVKEERSANGCINKRSAGVTALALAAGGEQSGSGRKKEDESVVVNLLSL